MKVIHKVVLGCAFAAIPLASKAQASNLLSSTKNAEQATRYFKLTLVLRYPSAKSTPEPGEQSITTEVAVGTAGRTGSCKTRMTSQVPVTIGGPGTQFSKDGTKFVELGTKFDCNNVHIEADGLAFSIVLETSRVTGMIETGGTNRDGTPMEEPIITQRNLELAVRLPLDKPKVIFDSNIKPTTPLKPLQENPKQLPNKMEDPPLQIEVTATELK